MENESKIRAKHSAEAPKHHGILKFVIILLVFLIGIGVRNLYMV